MDVAKELAKDLENVYPKYMTYAQIKRLVLRLAHKYADYIEANKLRTVAERFCNDMANAVTGKKRGRPRALHEWAEIFMRRARARDLNPQHGLDILTHYLERCLDMRILPQASEIMRELLPGADRRGLIPTAEGPPARF